MLGQSIAWPLVVLLLHAPALLAMHAAFPSAWKHVHVCCVRCRRSKTQPHLYTRLQCGPHSRNRTRCTHGSNHVISGPCVYGDTHTHLLSSRRLLACKLCVILHHDGLVSCPLGFFSCSLSCLEGLVAAGAGISAMALQLWGLGLRVHICTCTLLVKMSAGSMALLLLPAPTLT